MHKTSTAAQALDLATFIANGVLSSVARPGRCPVSAPWLMTALKLAGSVLNGYRRAANTAEYEHAARLYSRIVQALRR